MIGTGKTRLFGGQRVLAEKVIVGDEKKVFCSRWKNIFFRKELLFSKRLKYHNSKAIEGLYNNRVFLVKLLPVCLYLVAVKGSRLLSVAFWKIRTALTSHMTCYNLNLNYFFPIYKQVSKMFGRLLNDFKTCL